MAKNLTKYTDAKEIRVMFPPATLASSLTETDINQIFITKAEAVIDSHLVNRYTLPFSNTPPLVKSIAQDLSLHYVMKRFYTQGGKDANTWVQDLRKDAMELLGKIEKGDILLTDNSMQALSERTDLTQIWTNVETYNPTFDNRDQIYQRIDPNRLDDEQDADDAAD